jgi:hypothetical protein
MAGVHFETSGATKVLPAPVIVVSLFLAPAAAIAVSAIAAAAMSASPLFIDVLSYRLEVPGGRAAASVPRARGRVG